MAIAIAFFLAIAIRLLAIAAMILSSKNYKNPQRLMDQLQRDAGILPHLRPQLWRQPQAAHGRGPRQQQTPGDTRHLGAQLQGAAAPNASGAGGWFARLPPENGGKSWDISLKGGNCCGKNVYFRGKRGFLPL